MLRFARSFVGADAHIGPPRARNGKRGDLCRTRVIFNTLCRGGRLCPPSKSGVFPWLFVGADAHLGAKSRALRGCASKLACGRRIGPLKCCEFALVFHKTEQFRRADRVVRPYGAKRKTNADSPENRHKTGVSCGSMWASTPTVRNGKRGDFPPDQHDFSRASVGADDSVRPQNPAIFVTAPTAQNKQEVHHVF